MKTTLRLEELAMLLGATYLFYQQDLHFAWFFLLILTPDIGMIGYLINDKIGAFNYNIFHHKGLALAMYAMGWYISNDILLIIGIILFAHASLDRIFGYGLKYEKGFKFTHLGKLGNE